MPGTVYLVATPLGNLEDITLRALRILKEVDLIACEDTRHTGRLLRHFEIRKPLLSYHEYNEAGRATELVDRARNGESIAVVCDAGMPGISDPGYRIVEQAVAAGVAVVPVPGPVAIEAALAASGLPTDSFRFGGFLPSRRMQRRKALAALAEETATLVFYEAPHRILATLDDVGEVLGERPVVVARELTKLHEEFVRGTPQDVSAVLQKKGSLRGEITLLIGKGAPPKSNFWDVAVRVRELMDNDHLTRMNAIKRVAKEGGISKREVYRLLETEPRA